MNKAYATIKLVIFDLDGTVFMGNLDFTAIRQELGVSSEEPILEYIDKLPCEKDRRYYHGKIYQIERECANKGVITPSAIPVFDLLEKNHITMAIWTRNSHQATQIALGDQFARFHHVETRESSKPKPHLAGLHNILKLCQVDLHEVLFVGDSILDIQASQSSGIKTLILRNPDSNHFNADCIHLIDDLSQIEQHLYLPPA